LDKIVLQIAAELKVRPAQINTAVELLDGGATVPFIARYRKEATDGLDDIQLRELETRLAYLRELEDRRAAVLKSIDEQGKLTPELRAAIEAAPTKQELEDLYLPFKPKRRTKGMIAREAGSSRWPTGCSPTRAGPAGRGRRLHQRRGRLCRRARGAGRCARHPVRALGRRRRAGGQAARVAVGRGPAAEQAGRRQGRQPRRRAKFRDYFDYAEPIRTVPSHRALAVFRGRTLEWLDAKLVLDEEVVPGKPGLAEGRIARHLGWSHASAPADDLIRKTIAWTWKVKLSLSLERDLFAPPARSGRGQWPSRSSPTTCATCCWPHRPASAW
jgi:uncharacterized protein